MAVVLPNPLPGAPPMPFHALPSQVLRSFLEMVSSMLAPPQPLRYCADVDEAMDFLAGVRVARSYAKDQRA